MSDRWGGYAKSSPITDLTQNPLSNTLLAIVWFSCATMLIVGQYIIPAALVNLVLCRYFFVRMRWQGVLRGMGAPGLMSYWLAAAVFIMELTLHYAPDLQSIALLMLQVDFAFIMLSAGIYKASAGYARNHGMEYGMVNPEWGYWWKFYKGVSPSNVIFPVLNHLAWGTEVVAAVLMLIPPTRFLGSLLILGSFIYIATQIRLGVLCEMVMLACLLFFHPGSFGDQICTLLVPSYVVSSTAPLPFAQQLHTVLAACFWGYLILLPFAHAGLFYNFYGKKALPKPIQMVLERYTNFFGLIIWRVFSVDVVNFFIQIHRVSKESGKRTLVSKYGWQGGTRYDHVGESITITSLFTTLKYYSGNAALFNERLLRYARTIPCSADSILEFEYMSVRKATANFEFVPVAKYFVDPRDGSVIENILDESTDVRAAHAVSPIHEGAKPGSYVPLGK